ncbi:DUF2798 domain-containing protein [Paenibacillus sp. D2_2]|uniref:DUF2798 domain-containing protein n=1 Tax=Paenibacillus sp. D2_2 TaxID=3073092 RepID=UPI0028162CF4|nr:DUF2798 domain-containing protein [Paenibacillus sp. D2_2]WMT40808.1 DUF2798 domain-containing protein [Paenibacillus sp. D2_2]
MKINKKYEHIIFTILMGLGISFFISFVLVSINMGYNNMFMTKWLNMWGEAFICAVPCAYFFPKGIKKVMKRITFVE